MGILSDQPKEFRYGGNLGDSTVVIDGAIYDGQRLADLLALAGFVAKLGPSSTPDLPAIDREGVPIRVGDRVEVQWPATVAAVIEGLIKVRPDDYGASVFANTATIINSPNLDVPLRWTDPEARIVLDILRLTQQRFSTTGMQLSDITVKSDLWGAIIQNKEVREQASLFLGPIVAQQSGTDSRSGFTCRLTACHWLTIHVNDSADLKPGHIGTDQPGFTAASQIRVY
jgi:hypothetical protein